MTTWSKGELGKIAATDDLHVAPFREDRKTYGTPTWIWSVVVDGALYVRAYVGKRDGSDLGGSPRQQRGEPWPMPSAVDLGVADYGKCASREQAAQIAIALLADTAEPVLATARVLLRYQSDPGREVPS